jgi:hypothetical protein
LVADLLDKANRGRSEGLGLVQGTAFLLALDNLEAASIYNREKLAVPFSIAVEAVPGGSLTLVV